MKLKSFNVKRETKKEKLEKKKITIFILSIMTIVFLTLLIYQTYAIYKLKDEHTMINTTVQTFSKSDVLSDNVLILCS